MLKLINIKILLAILAAVLALGALLVHVHAEHERQAAAIKARNAQLWDAVRKQRQKNDAAPVNGSKTWTTYLP